MPQFLLRLLSESEIIPITHVAFSGTIQFPNKPKIQTVSLVDDLQEHSIHLSHHFADQATVTLTHYHMQTEEAMIFDLDVDGKNYRYIFKVSAALLNILQTSKCIVIVNPKGKILFVSNVSGCQSAIDQLANIMIRTEMEKLFLKFKNKKGFKS